jgi:outer membrane protein OmpA-like peptidoglycan-associated protein
MPRVPPRDGANSRQETHLRRLIMTRHPIRDVLLLMGTGAVLAACAASPAPPSKPVAHHATMAPRPVVTVRVPPGTTYVAAPTTGSRTTYAVKIEHHARALEATRAELGRTQQELARTQQELAATRQELAKGAGTLDERGRAMQQRAAELSSRTEELRAREHELAQRQAELVTRSEQLRAESQAREQAQRERDAALARVREMEKHDADERELVILLTGTVMFRHDEATLLPQARARLDRVADALKQMPADRKIVIEGHADALGTDEYNRRLSEDRAQAVRSYLLQRGVASDRVVAVGRGENQPIAPNQTAEGRANNRRVEIVISRSQATDAG